MLCDAIRRRRTFELGNGHELVVSRESAVVRGYTLVRVEVGRTVNEDTAAVCRQLCADCRRFRVSLRVEQQDDSRMVVGVFVYIPRLEMPVDGLVYTLEFERRGRAGSRMEHLAALERALDAI